MDSEPTGLMPTCKEAHRLTSEALDRELTLMERTRLRMHLLICIACTNMQGQMALMRKAMRQMPLGDAPESAPESAAGAELTQNKNTPPK